MFFKQPDLTSGSRPILQQDETLLFVQNSVGLYEGKYKIADCQNGHAYLTSHRACYVDDVDPRKNSLAIDLRDVDRHEYQAAFLRSSAKVTFHPKPPRRGFGSLRQPSASSGSGLQRLQASSSSSPVTRTSSPFRPPPVAVAAPPANTGNWICPICTFTNPVPSNFDPATVSESFPIPPCLTCGIPPPYAVVLKAAISDSFNRPVPTTDQLSSQDNSGSADTKSEVTTKTARHLICPRCTFHNHYSLQNCEICGASLPSSHSPSTVNLMNDSRSGSPAPEIAHLNIEEMGEAPMVKFSFRQGGDKVFYERLKHAMIQRKWLVTNAPPIPRPLDKLRTTTDVLSDSSPPGSPVRPKSTGVGIAGLEQRGLQNRKNNETVIGTAFEDLEALMASAKDIVALAEKFAAQSRDLSRDPSLDPVLSESAAALGMIATRDMLSDGSNDLYISELARDLAEYVTDERRGILRRQGGTMSLVDLWAVFNRSRNGLELVSPADFYKATEKWSSLGLPVRLRRFRSGLLVVQRHDWNDEKAVAQLLGWLESLRRSPPETTSWDWLRYGCGVTAQDAAQRFGWSLGVASEELEMAEERGALCREEGIEGLKFWINAFTAEEEAPPDT